jgi:hypothetical protein
VTVTTDKTRAKARRFDDFAGSAFATRKLSDRTRCSIAVDLDARHDWVTSSEVSRISSLINARALSSTTLFGEGTEDSFGELGGGTGKTEKSVGIGSLICGRSRCRVETQIKWELERMANSWDAANDVGAVNRAAVPSACSGMGCFDKDDVAALVIGSDGGCFVEEPMEFFDANGLMITAWCDMDVNFEGCADGLNKTFESAAVINDD